MKEYRGPSGDRRLWYEPGEIEEIMLDELHRAGLVPNGEQDDASVDIEAFVEKHLGLSFDLSAELDTDVLGATDFIPGHRPKISVNRDLTGSALDEEDATLVSSVDGGLPLRTKQATYCSIACCMS